MSEHWDTCQTCQRPIFWALGGQFWLHGAKAGDPPADHIAPNPPPAKNGA